MAAMLAPNAPQFLSQLPYRSSLTPSSPKFALSPRSKPASRASLDVAWSARADRHGEHVLACFLLISSRRTKMHHFTTRRNGGNSSIRPSGRARRHGFTPHNKLSGSIRWAWHFRPCRFIESGTPRPHRSFQMLSIAGLRAMASEPVESSPRPASNGRSGEAGQGTPPA